MDNGYVFLKRKLLDNSLMLHPELLQLFIYCLLKCNHKANKFIFNHKEIEIERGSFIFGRNATANDLKINPSSVYRRIRYLVDLGLITQKTNNKFSIISVVKYDENNIRVSKLNNNRTTNEQPSNTNNNDNNDNNVKQGDVKNFNVNNFKYLENTLFNNTWNEFKEHRKQIKHTLTDMGEKKLLTKLAGFEVSIAIKMINESIINGWQGIFELKSNNYKNNKVAEVFSVKVRKCSGCNQNLTDGGVCYTSECSNYAQRVSSVPVGLANLININGKTN